MLRDARSSREPNRRVVPSAMTGAGAPSALGKVSGKSRMPPDLGAPEAVDRLVGVADDDQVAAVAGDGPEQGDLARVGVLVLVDEDMGEARPAAAARWVARLDHRRANRSA